MGPPMWPRPRNAIRPAPTAPASLSLISLAPFRHHEMRALPDPGGPAARNGLRLGVEAERVRAVLVEVPEARGFPAAEGVVRDRHGDGHVDADHAHLDSAREVAGRIAVAREDRHAVTVRVLAAQ